MHYPSYNEAKVNFQLNFSDHICSRFIKIYLKYLHARNKDKLRGVNYLKLEQQASNNRLLHWFRDLLMFVAHKPGICAVFAASPCLQGR